MGCCNSAPVPTERDSSLEYQQIKSIWSVVKFIRILGHGGSAKVCLVSSLETQELYALKLMDEKYDSMFLEEVRMMKILDGCPQIVRFVAAYKDKHHNCILMEYCSGKSLLGRIVEKRNYTEGIASTTTKTMLLALKYLHDKDIVHRDLKPENFVYLTDEDDTLKLLDFGIAMDALPDKLYTWQAGTPHYMAPEIIQGEGSRSGEICKKGDMWALGVCIFIMLNGQAPFKGSNLMAIFDNIVAQSKIRFSTPGISKEAKDFVFKLLRREPMERLGVDDALQHPWVMNFEKNQNEIKECTLDALRLFNCKRTVSKALQNLSLANLNEYDDTHYINRFKQFDRDGNGHISREECVAGLQLSMMYPIEAERLASQLFDSADLNKDNKLQYNEFKNSMFKGLSHDEYRMHAIFTALDHNHDGNISVEDFTSCLPQGDNEEAAELIAAFKEADESKDDCFSFWDFEKILNSSPQLIATAFKLLEPEAVTQVIDVDGKGRGSQLGHTNKKPVKLEYLDSHGLVMNEV